MIAKGEFVPYQKIGAFTFGMHRDEVQKSNQSYRTFMCGFPVRNHICDDFRSYHAYYRPDYTLEAISLFPDFEIKYKEQVITVTDDVEALTSKLRLLCTDLKYIENESTYVSLELGIVLYCENGDLSNMLVFSKEYFDEENEYLKHNFGVTKFGL